MPYKTPELRRKNYLENRDKQLTQSVEWKRNNRPKARASYTKWANKNPDKVKASRKAYYESNREAALVYSAKFRAEHSKVVKKNLAKWKRENPEKVSVIFHKRRTAKTKAGGAYTSEQWTALCDKYDNHCLCCGKKKKLTADHIVPVSKGGTSDIRNIQPLCGPCNSSKGNKSTDFRKKRKINGRNRKRRRNN